MKCSASPFMFKHCLKLKQAKWLPFKYSPKTEKNRKLCRALRGVRTEEINNSNTVGECFGVGYGEWSWIKNPYSWIERQKYAHKKYIPNESEGLQQFRDHRWKALDEENPDMRVSFLRDLFLTSFFKITFQTMSKQLWNTQSQIRLVKYPCAKVSDPSEVSRFVGIFLSYFRKSSWSARARYYRACLYQR